MINSSKYHILNHYGCMHCDGHHFVCHDYNGICLRCGHKVTVRYRSLALYTELEGNLEEFFKLLYSI